MSNVEERTLVLNDILSFIWCNFKICYQKELLNCLKGYYSFEEGHQAHQILLATLGHHHAVEHLQKQNDYEPFLAMYNLLKETPKEKLPIFVCRNLSNVPTLKTKVVVRKSFHQEHNVIKAQISEVCEILYYLKEQFEILTGTFSNISMNAASYSMPSRSSEHLRLLKTNNKFKQRGNLHQGITGTVDQTTVRKKEVQEDTLDDDETDFECDDVDAIDDLVDEDQKIQLIANRHQRALARRVEHKSLRNHSTHPAKVAELSYKQKSMLVVSPSKQTFIKNELDTAIALGISNSQYETSEDGEGALKIIDKQNYSKNCPFIKVEQIFDENVGHFKIFRCSNCKFVSNDEVTTILHSCSKKYARKKKVPQIAEIKPATKVHKCCNCMQIFGSHKALLQHRKTDCNSSYRCPLCTNQFLAQEWLPHVRNCAGNGTTTREDHYCSVCDVFFADKKILGFHKAHHDISKPFECIICRYRFYTQKAVTDHMKRHVAYDRNPKCPFCNFHSTKNLKVTEHIRSHTGDRPYKCHLCDHNTATRDTLKAHIRSHDPRKDFKCDVCGKAFKSMSKLGNHKRMHTNEKPYKCPICGKGFRFGMQMTLHHRTHLDIRKHACPVCPYRARAANVLRGHMNTHTNARPFKCSKCDFASNYKSYLRCHLKSFHPELI